jgi:hypothetical protein
MHRLLRPSLHRRIALFPRVRLFARTAVPPRTFRAVVPVLALLVLPDGAREGVPAARGGEIPAAAGPAGSAAADAVPAVRRAWRFETDRPGTAPKGFRFQRTGEGTAGRWVVRIDESSREGSRVLVQEDPDPDREYRFPMAIAEGVRFRDGVISVDLSLREGERWRAAGIVYRCVDADNYGLVAIDLDRASLAAWRFTSGKRKSLGSFPVTIKHRKWQTLEVRLRGKDVAVEFDGRYKLAFTDPSPPVPGEAGLWTMCDTIAGFDALAIGPPGAEDAAGD